ncbi:hypothetical protein OPFAMLBM_00107 [Aeromonas phage avDM12-TAAL]|nr:hypothetical protein OPFAMLBM_00107 [Aeromonas phage avDM12-TAAL]
MTMTIGKTYKFVNQEAMENFCSMDHNIEIASLIVKNGGKFTVTCGNSSADYRITTKFGAEIAGTCRIAFNGVEMRMMVVIGYKEMEFFEEA